MLVNPLDKLVFWNKNPCADSDVRESFRTNQLVGRRSGDSQHFSYADLKEHIGVDCSEYQYQEEYQRGVYTWYAAEDEACCLSLFFGDNGKLMAAGAYNLSL